MENEDSHTVPHGRRNQAYTVSPTNSSYYSNTPDRVTSSPPVRTPGNSPAKSSFSSDVSSLSHGPSPPPGSPQPPVGTPSPVLEPMATASTAPVVNRYVRDEPTATKKLDPAAQDGYVRSSLVGGGRRLRPLSAGVSRSEKEKVVKRAAFGIRLFEFLFCLISFSVMAADKNQGWALDSFYRYREFRYCMAVNVIGLVYSGVQGCDLAYQLSIGNNGAKHYLRYYLDFAIDQVMTYLLISASSSAATRVVDWTSNWGKDKFPEMASASVGLSFVAFVSFAFSSLISGYSLCGLHPT